MTAETCGEEDLGDAEVVGANRRLELLAGLDECPA